MSEYNKILFQILNIYKYLILNYNKLDENQITDLYIEYLKLFVQIGTNNPEYSKDFDKYFLCNCYCYALGFKYPTLFHHIYKHITDEDFGHNIGFISKKDYIKDINMILETLYSDLDILKISVYDSSINTHPKHGGYKISLFLENSGEDFHFIRQNYDGSWSDKIGYTSTIRQLDYPEPEDLNYKHVKTIEIVKPVIKTLK